MGDATGSDWLVAQEARWYWRTFAASVLQILLLAGAVAMLLVARQLVAAIVLGGLVAVCNWGLLRPAYARATRFSVGIASEDEVRRVLERHYGGSGEWTVLHNVRWPGHGDIDHLLIHRGVRYAWAIETKTKTVPGGTGRRLRRACAYVLEHFDVRGVTPLIVTVHDGHADPGSDGVPVVPLGLLPAVVLPQLPHHVGTPAIGSRPAHHES